MVEEAWISGAASMYLMVMGLFSVAVASELKSITPELNPLTVVPWPPMMVTLFWVLPAAPKSVRVHLMAVLEAPAAGYLVTFFYNTLFL